MSTGSFGGWASLGGGRSVLVRPARPTDAPLVQAFVRGLSPLARRRRFFGPVAELSPDQLDRVTRVNDPRELVLVAVAPGPGSPELVGMAQHALEGEDEAEFALVVADAWQRHGLGARLLAALETHAAAAGLRALTGDVLADNWPMLCLLAARGFELHEDGDPRIVRARKSISATRRGGVAAQLGAFVSRATRGFEVAAAR